MQVFDYTQDEDDDEVIHMLDEIYDLLTILLMKENQNFTFKNVKNALTSFAKFTGANET